MFNIERVTELAARMDAIAQTISEITTQQKEGILASHDNRLDRIDAVLHGVQANQIQLVALVSALTSAFMEYLLDEQQQQELGIES